MGVESDGWHYRDKPTEGDARKIVTLQEDGMTWVGIRAFHFQNQTWLHNNEPEKAHVLAWRDLDEPARGFWDRGLFTACSRATGLLGASEAMTAQSSYPSTRPGLETTLRQIERLASKATKGPWFTDSERTEGTYGVGDETHEGFNMYAVFSETIDYYGKPARIFDTSTDVAMVHDEFDEDGHTAWDEQGRCNAEYLVAVQPSVMLALCDSLLRELESARAEEREKIVGWLREDARAHDELAVEFFETDMDMARSHKSIAHTSSANADAIERGDHLQPQGGA